MTGNGRGGNVLYMQGEKGLDGIFHTLVRTAALLLVICLVAGVVLGIMALTEGQKSLGEKPSDPSQPSTDVPGEEKPGDHPGDISPTGEDPDKPTVTVLKRQLPETIDFGQSYLDSLVFLGESTTAHLRSRGVLSGGRETRQVWSDKSNTMTLGLNILNQKIVYPDTGEEMTIVQATALAKPKILVLSFGLNGILAFHAKEGLYSTAYAKLIQAIHTASPSTVVILQTVYPVAENQKAFQDMSAGEVNQYVGELNAQLEAIAKENNAWVVDTASVVTDASGMLCGEDQVGDGIHLTAGAYEKILRYMRTHAYSE